LTEQFSFCVYKIISKLESNYIKSNTENIYVGDIVTLGIKIQEGEKNRVQNYSGVVISKKNTGLNKMITVRKTMQGIGIERCFLVNSPKITNIEIKNSSYVRRSKLYFLRKLSGKTTRLKEIIH
jgi:large subunit ribosomal protein L19